MATLSSILACRTLWTGEPGGRQFMGWQRVKYHCTTEHNAFDIRGSNKPIQVIVRYREFDSHIKNIFL